MTDFFIGAIVGCLIIYVVLMAWCAFCQKHLERIIHKGVTDGTISVNQARKLMEYIP